MNRVGTDVGHRAPQDKEILRKQEKIRHPQMWGV